MGNPGRRIMLGVTADVSLTLMRGFPAFLVAQGWEVHVVCSPGPLAAELAGVSGVTLHELKMERDPAPFADTRALLDWIRLLREVRPDVLSVGTPKAGLLGGVAGALTRVPNRFYQLRGLRLETAHGVKRRILAAVEWLALRSAHKVIAVSPSLRDRVIALKLVAPSKVVVVAHGSSNGVEMERFSAERFPEQELADLRELAGIRAGLFTVGFVGRLTADKGLTELLGALETLEAEGIALQLLIVGAVDNQSGDQILQRLRSGRTKIVETGHVADPAPYYQLMDVLCLPTLREGFPNVVLEAASAGKMTITTNATGAIDSVIDGATGFVVKAGSSDELSQAITRCVREQDRVREMSQNAWHHVASRYRQQDVWDALQLRYATTARSGDGQGVA